jgi:hypothetical protein
MIERSASDFLMTSAQHRQWARILQPEKARRHEELARVIERLEQCEAEAQTVASPPIAPVYHPPNKQNICFGRCACFATWSDRGASSRSRTGSNVEPDKSRRYGSVQPYRSQEAPPRL